MAHASVQGSRFKRSLAVGIVLLAVVGLTLALAQRHPVLAKDPPKTQPAKPADTKAADTPRTVPSVLPENVAEVVKLIDSKLEEAWAANKVKPAERCTDYDFIRRVSLDLIGRIAKPEEIDTYLKDPAETRRALLVERLLKSEEYAKNWGYIWSNWLLTRSGTFGRGKYHEQMHIWLEDQFAQNAHYDQFVRDLIAANGNSKDNGNVTFILAHVGEPIPPAKQGEEGQFEMVPITARITRLFLGVQTQCTQCHDHPFDSRKQSEFWGVNAFMRQVERKGTPGGKRGQQLEDLTLSDNANFNKPGSVFYEKRNGVVLETAPFLDGKKPAAGAPRRAELAKFVVQHENFSKAYINRMWAHFMGKGFCNPIDDFNSQNQVNHPELLQELGDKFKHYGFDTKVLIRWIRNSRAYNLKAVANATNDKPEQDVLFSRMLLKAMSPEELFESLMVATQAEAAQTKEGKKDLREQWMNKLVLNFGDDEGNEVTFNGTVVQALLMMNGDDINKAIADPKATVGTMMQRRMTLPGNITHLYLVALNRPPSSDEMKKIMGAMPLLRSKDKDMAAPMHDLLWALLNSNEFILNH